jgi:exosome complex component RRP42
VLNHDGNLLDASTLAAVAALNSAWIPKYEDEKVVRERAKDLPLTKLPVSFTFAQVGNSIILDPILDEEFAMDARLTIATTDKHICAMQKGEIGAFKPEEISIMVDKAMANYSKVKKLLK